MAFVAVGCARAGSFGPAGTEWDGINNRFNVVTHRIVYDFSYGSGSTFSMIADPFSPTGPTVVCVNECDHTSEVDITISPIAGFMITSIGLEGVGSGNNYAEGGYYAYTSATAGSATWAQHTDCCANWYHNLAWDDHMGTKSISSDQSVHLVFDIRSIAQAQGSCSVHCAGANVPQFIITVNTSTDTLAPEPVPSALVAEALLPLGWIVYRSRRKANGAPSSRAPSPSI